MNLTVLGLLAILFSAVRVSTQRQCLGLFISPNVDANTELIQLNIEQNTRTLEGFFETLTYMTNWILETIDRKIDETNFSAVERVEAEVDNIIDRPEIYKKCWNELHIEQEIKNLEASIDDCIDKASANATIFFMEIVNLAQGIAKDTMSFVDATKRCEWYHTALLKTNCFGKHLIKTNNMITETRRDIEVTIKSVDETIPEILTELGGCFERAEQNAYWQLNGIAVEIDYCIDHWHYIY